MITDSNAAAPFCVYCKSIVIIKDRLVNASSYSEINKKEFTNYQYSYQRSQVPYFKTATISLLLTLVIVSSIVNSNRTLDNQKKIPYVSDEVIITKHYDERLRSKISDIKNRSGKNN